MIAKWEDTPKDGLWYDIFILTTIQSTGGITLHRYNNLQFTTNLMNYTIPSGRQNQFVAGNGGTSGTFPGFVPNNQYRVYIRYVNAAGTQLNKAGGQTEMSLHAVAMVQVSEPLNVAKCAGSDVTSSPCYRFPVSLSVRVKWDRPLTVGYGTYFPTPAYDIDYYVIELAESSAFAPVTHTYTCLVGAITAQCRFDDRIAMFTDINTASVYKFRVRAGTIIGQGLNSIAATATTGATSESTCVACGAGYYTTTAGATSNTACLKCAAGKYATTTVNALADCTYCAAGTYSAATGASAAATCGACPVSSSSPISSSALANCTCNAGYSGPDGAACTPCQANTYKTTTGSAQCTSCPANLISPVGSTSSAACADCNAGYTGPSGGPCVACQTGTWKSATGSGSCTGCPLYSGGTCTPCTDSTGCQCNAGYSGPNGGSCWPCLTATYKSTSGAQACSSCPANSGTDGSALTTCPCDTGFTGPDGGVCSACAAGTYKSVVGSAACQACPASSYQAASGASACAPCPANAVSPDSSSSQTACLCNAGYTGPAGSACTPCASSTYKSTAGAQACTSCPSYSVSPVGSALQTNCVCNGGYSGNDGGPCTACAAGKYKSGSGSAACLSCAFSTTSPPASVNCFCDVGYFDLLFN